MKLLARPLAYPIRNLFILWISWKFILLLIAACSPGPGYDTSASLLSPTETGNRELPNIFRYLVTKLTRWDAIYFVKAASRGYLYEQEWAFGWGFTRAIALCTSGRHHLHALAQIH
jgi:phosphatidylinositol glycan class V